jgi:hypothetical protein
MAEGSENGKRIMNFAAAAKQQKRTTDGASMALPPF